jgi:two-component system cell cycle response regulator DivK
MKTILVADDNADNRAMFAILLASGGYRVCQAADGRQAVDAAERELPDLILLDMSMPVLDGWEAARLLKAGERTRHIPLWAFTAFALEGDEARVREAGCDGYVTKPCMPREVLRKIRELVEK